MCVGVCVCRRVCVLPTATAACPVNPYVYCFFRARKGQSIIEFILLFSRAGANQYNLRGAT